MVLVLSFQLLKILWNKDYKDKFFRDWIERALVEDLSCDWLRVALNETNRIATRDVCILISQVATNN